jgi:3-hydroxybutyryl-CoA dehydrogenase
MTDEASENDPAVDLRRIGVVGAGLMGSGIAEVCSRATLDVVVAEVDRDSLRAARERIERSFGVAVEREKLTPTERDAAVERIRFTVDLADLSDRELVIEAVAEQILVKESIFQSLEAATPSTCILATNTSSISISKIAAATQSPERVIGIHFFNPPTVMPLVEIIGALQTSASTIKIASHFVATQLNKVVIRSVDRAGFVVNALLVPYIFSAIHMVEAGFATQDDVDEGMRAGCGHPMGPIRLADLIGLDTLQAIGERLFDEYKEPQYATPPLLARLVESGYLGKKTGRGFYSYG